MLLNIAELAWILTILSAVFYNNYV